MPERTMELDPAAGGGWATGEVGGLEPREGTPVKSLAVSAAFVLGVALGGGQALANAAIALVSDDGVTVETPTPTPEEPGTDTGTDPTGDATDGAADESTEGPGGESESEAGDLTATATPYGQLVSMWVHCVEAGGTDCGDRPHPPGAANGWDPARVPGHVHSAEAPDGSTGQPTKTPEVQPAPKHDAKHAGRHAGQGRTH
jgi:hypothetical protein